MLLLVLFSYSCANNNEKSLLSNKIAQIDSISYYIDSLYKIETPVKEEGIIEQYQSYGRYYSKEFPGFSKYAIHHHDSLFTDSVFYYYNDSLIKFTTKKDQRK